MCGFLSEILVGPESVELYSSRGYEDPTHKAYMRFTVLILDIAIYFTAVWSCATILSNSGSCRNDNDSNENNDGNCDRDLDCNDDDSLITEVNQKNATNRKFEKDDRNHDPDKISKWKKTEDELSETQPEEETGKLVTRNRFWWIVLVALTQPSLVLIDHGHFQYNSFSLGLALWAFYYISGDGDSANVDESRENNKPEIINNDDDINSIRIRSLGWDSIKGSVIFCLALNFKQMELFHAPAVFSYLLGRCAFIADSQQQKYDLRPLRLMKWCIDFIKCIGILGVTVVSTFAILWSPIVINLSFFSSLARLSSTLFSTPSSSSNISITANMNEMLKITTQVLSRIFPLRRGLYEGKVSNLWCALSHIGPWKIRNLIPEALQPRVAAFATLILLLPSSFFLFQVGRRRKVRFYWDQASKPQLQQLHWKLERHQRLRAILFGVTGAALSFFLAGYQIHEKSILLASSPLSLLVLSPRSSSSSSLYSSSSFSRFTKSSTTMTSTTTGFVLWFSTLSTWSMWHLFTLDRLEIAYFACIGIFWLIFQPLLNFQHILTTSTETSERKATIVMEAKISEKNLNDKAAPSVFAASVLDTKKDPVSTYSVVSWMMIQITYIVNLLFLPGTAAIMILLHFAELLCTPPASLPDIFPVLWTITGCFMFSVSWVVTIYHLWKIVCVN